MFDGGCHAPAEPPGDGRSGRLRALLVGTPARPAPDGIEAEAWRSITLELPGALAARPFEAIRRGSAVADVGPIGRADVVVLRDTYAVAPACLRCGVHAPDEEAQLAHAAAGGHPWRRPFDAGVAALVERVAADPSCLLGRGLVYELAGDPLADAGTSSPLPPGDRELVGRLLAMADVVVALDEAAVTAARRAGVPPARLAAAISATAGDADRAAAWRRAAGARDPAALARRLARRAHDASLAARLAARHRDGRPSWDEDALRDPLVSALVTADEAPAELVERAVASVLAAEGVRVEAVVLGTPSELAALGAIDADDRVRLVPVPAAARLDRPDARRAALVAAGLRAAGGDWIGVLAPDAVWTPELPATLLEVAGEHALDLAWGQAILVRDGEPVGGVGAWPPAPESIVPDAGLWSAALRGIEPDPTDLDGEEPLWNTWRRCLEAGARAAAVEAPLALIDLHAAGARASVVPR